MSKRVLFEKAPAWPEIELIQRLLDCRLMLVIHGVLTGAEAEKVMKRIRQLKGEKSEQAE